MSSFYNLATVCPYKKEDCTENERLTLDPHLTERLAKSRDYDELKYLWTQWRDHSGKLMRSDYKNYVQLMNELAKENGYPNAGLYWQSDFEDPEFEELVDKTWLTVKPLYDQLHQYMKFKLIEIYGNWS